MDGGGVMTKRLWTPSEDAVLLSTPSNKRAAARLPGRSPTSCRNRRYFLRYHDVSPGRGKRDPADVRRIAFLLVLAESCAASPSVALCTLALHSGGHWRDVLDEAAARRLAS